MWVGLQYSSGARSFISHAVVADNAANTPCRCKPVTTLLLVVKLLTKLPALLEP